MKLRVNHPRYISIGSWVFSIVLLLVCVESAHAQSTTSDTSTEVLTNEGVAEDVEIPLAGSSNDATSLNGDEGILEVEWIDEEDPHLPELNDVLPAPTKGPTIEKYKAPATAEAEADGEFIYGSLTAATTTFVGIGAIMTLVGIAGGAGLVYLTSAASPVWEQVGPLLPLLLGVAAAGALFVNGILAPVAITLTALLTTEDVALSDRIDIASGGCAGGICGGASLVTMVALGGAALGCALGGFRLPTTFGATEILIPFALGVVAASGTVIMAPVISLLGVGAATAAKSPAADGLDDFLSAAEEAESSSTDESQQNF